MTEIDMIIRTDRLAGIAQNLSSDAANAARKRSAGRRAETFRCNFNAY